MNGAREPGVPTPVAALGMTAAAWLLLVMIAGLAGDSGAPTLGLALGTVAGFGGIGTLAARAVPPPVEEKLGLRGFPPRILVLILLMAPVVVLASEADNYLAAWLKTAAAPGSAASANPQASIGALGVLGVAIFSVGIRPVVEEFFFRGVVLQGAVSRLGVGSGLLFTTALFALVRASFGVDFSSLAAYHVATLGAAAFMEGWLLGVLRLASGSLLAPMLLAALSTGAGLMAQLGKEIVPIPGFNAPGAHTPLVWLVPCAGCVALGLYWARRERLRRAESNVGPADPPARHGPEMPL